MLHRFTSATLLAFIIIGLAMSVPSALARPAEFESKELRLRASPLALAMTPSGRTVYAVYPDQRLIAFDAGSGVKAGVIAIGQGASSVAAARSTVVLAQGDPAVALVIDATEGRRATNRLTRVRARVPIGPGAGVVAVTPDGSSAWIGVRDVIGVLALDSATITRRIDLPGTHHRIVFAGSRAWVLSDEATVTHLDVASGEILARRDLGEPVSDIAVAANGSSLFAALPGADAVESMDPTSLQPIDRASAGPDPVALMLTWQSDGVIAFGAKEPTYLRSGPLRLLGTVSGLGAASMAAISPQSRRAWIAGGKAAWIVDRAVRPSVSIQVEPTKAGLEGYPAIEALRKHLDAALSGDVRVLGAGTMELDQMSGTAPMRLEVIRSGATTFRDDGRIVTYMSSTEVCVRNVGQVVYACRARGPDEPDLVEQFRRSMPWERSGTASRAYTRLEDLSRASGRIEVSLLFAPGPVGGAASGTTRYRLAKGTFSILESFGNGPYYEITTGLAKPTKLLPADLATLPRG